MVSFLSHSFSGILMGKRELISPMLFNWMLPLVCNLVLSPPKDRLGTHIALLCSTVSRTRGSSEWCSGSAKVFCICIEPRLLLWTGEMRIRAYCPRKSAMQAHFGTVDFNSREATSVLKLLWSVLMDGSRLFMNSF